MRIKNYLYCKKKCGTWIGLKKFENMWRCGKTADDSEGMLQIIAEEEGITDELLMQIIGTVELGDTLLMCAMAGNENQEYLVG